MNIVIVGAGNVGIYLAALLSKEEQNVILIDCDPRRLEEASRQLDIGTRLGSGTDWQLLEELLDSQPDVFLALTSDDETNLVACSIAKNLGYPRTIARLKSRLLLDRSRLDFGRMFDVDDFIGPEALVANDILKYALSPGSLAVESFAHGAVQLRTIAIPHYWRRADEPLSKLRLPPGVMVGLIKRHLPGHMRSKPAYSVIFPHGEDHIMAGDEVTFVGETDAIGAIPKFFGAAQEMAQSVVIVGGTLVGAEVARLLRQHGVSVRILEPDHEVCKKLAEQLPDCTVINHSGTDLEFLRSEKVGRTELFIACTESDEMNIVAALLAKEEGCAHVITLLMSAAYNPILERLGIATVAAPRVSAANRILSLVLSGRVSTVVSLYDNQAEVVEVQVSMHSKVLGISLAELGPLLPRDFLIAMIESRGRVMIANGNRVISPGDAIICISHPRHLRDIEATF